MAEMRMKPSDYRSVNASPRWLPGVMAVTLLSAVLVTSVTLSVTARAECVSVDAWRQGAIKGSPGFDVGPAELVTPALQAFITKAYNSTPPLSDFKPDAVYLLMGRLKENGMPFGDVQFGMFKEGCLVATFTAPLPHAKPVKAGEPV